MPKRNSMAGFAPRIEKPEKMKKEISNDDKKQITFRLNRQKWEEMCEYCMYQDTTFQEMISQGVDLLMRKKQQ